MKRLDERPERPTTPAAVARSVFRFPSYTRTRARARPHSGGAVSNDAALARALALVRDLRARCPWDQVQTRETLRPYLVEEVLELDQALRDGTPAEVRDELGDLLLHLAFQIVIGEERHELDA